MSAQDGFDAAAKRAANARVRPGDRIMLHFLRERELSESLTVSERGDVAFPKLGLVNVTGMTQGQLRDSLRTRYAEYFRTPELEIAVLRRIVVNGEVRIPNVYMVDAASTVRDVIARAGGVTETGSRKKVYIVRGDQRIDAGGWDRGVGTEVESGDQVIVGRKSWLLLNALPAVSTVVLVASLIISVTR